MPKPKRFMELEGLRGLAAVMVVLTHFAYTFYPTLLSGDTKTSHTTYDTVLFGTPFGVFTAGTFAVAIFFVLSGFVLSIGFFQTGKENIVRKLAIGRYLRLMLPAAASLLIAYVLIKAGTAQLMNETAHVTGSDWLLATWDDGAQFVNVVITSLVGIFVYPTTHLNNVLWTMQTELWGSFLVFGFLLLFGKVRYRWVPYVAALVLTIGLQQVLISYQAGAMAWFSPFVVGMILADLHTHGWLRKLGRPWIAWPMAIAGLVLGAVPGITYGTMYAVLDPVPITTYLEDDTRIMYLIIAASLVVTAVLSSGGMARVLRWRWVSSLGKYTFSLYLTHLFVIYTVACGVFLALHQRIGYNHAVLVAIGVSAVVIVVLTKLFHRYVDAPSTRFAKYVGALLTAEKHIDLDAADQKLRRRMKQLGYKYMGIGEAVE